MTALTVAGLTLREAFRRRVIWALLVLTVALLALSGWGFSKLIGLDTELGTLTSGEARLVASMLLNSHLIGEVERVCDRVVILDRGRVAASGTLLELLGQREVRLQLTGLSPAARARLAEAGDVPGQDEWFTVALPADDDGTAVPDLVRDLVALGARVHAVEPARISLEERLLEVLRHEDEDA